MKAEKHCNGVVSIDEMNDGDVADVIKWDSQPDMVEEVVQRYDLDLVVLGEDSNKSYNGLFQLPSNRDILVRILQKRTLLRL